MFKRVSIALAIFLVLALASGAWMSASAGDPEVPFKAYYPTIGVISPGYPCMEQVFTPGGNGLASHMGVSQFSGQATLCVNTLPPTQEGDGTLFAANGDYLTVHYVGYVSVREDGVKVSNGTYVVTGGHGRFEGVSGGGKFLVVVNNDVTQPNDLWFEGHLHNP